MRYSLKLAYDGTNYHGWQVQENAKTIQGEIQIALSTLRRISTVIVGCGRTDTGVHAWDYTAHFDTGEIVDENLVFKLNSMLPKDIAIKSCEGVSDDFHARFDARERSYQYHLHGNKDPFRDRYSYRFGRFDHLDWEKVMEGAQLIMEYNSFFTFCKSNNHQANYNCKIQTSYWVIDLENRRAVYHISANRFLRGMVRLIVGMCLNLGLGKISIEEIRTALEKQVLLSKRWSVPAPGLALSKVRF